jgi:hypothetical protein
MEEIEIRGYTVLVSKKSEESMLRFRVRCSSISRALQNSKLISKEVEEIVELSFFHVSMRSKASCRYSSKIENRCKELFGPDDEACRSIVA